MIFNNALKKEMTEGDKELWIKVINAVMLVGDYMSTFPEKHTFIVECHTISRALAMHIPELKLVDGSFLGLEVSDRNGDDANYRLRCCDHSWLETPDGAIIDPYPVGCISTNPLLIVSKGTYTHWGKDLYYPSAAVTAKIVGKTLTRKSKLFFRYIREAERLKKREQRLAA